MPLPAAPRRAAGRPRSMDFYAFIHSPSWTKTALLTIHGTRLPPGTCYPTPPAPPPPTPGLYPHPGRRLLGLLAVTLRSAVPQPEGEPPAPLAAAHA